MTDVDEDLPEISDSLDPWCAGCDVDVTPGPAYRIEGLEEDYRWPPLFCSESCAGRWGNAAMQDRIVRVDDDVLEEWLGEWADEIVDELEDGGQ